MALTYTGGIIIFAAAGDTVTERLRVKTLVITHTTATATVLKNGVGTTFLTIPSAFASAIYTIPFGDGVNMDGLELDAGGAGVAMTAYLA